MRVNVVNSVQERENEARSMPILWENEERSCWEESPSESPKEENKVDTCARNGENSGFLSSWFKPVSPKEWATRGANGLMVRKVDKCAES